jgi:hypothetical protein
MSRRLVPLAVLVAAVVGCAQQAPPGGGGESPTPGGDPTASYTIKFRDKQAGDKYEVIDSGTQSTNTTWSLPVGKQTKSEGMDFRSEFTETVLETTPGVPEPTKLTRVYKAADWTIEKKTLPAPFVGKTVTIEKKGDAYTFKADGKDLSGVQAQQLAEEFGKTRKIRLADLLPKTPVKLNEVWSPDPAALKDLASAIKLPVNADRSKMTGKLTRAYTKDGRQFGVIEVRTVLSIEGKGSSGPTGTFTVETTYDTPIDGSSYEGTMKVNMTGTLNGREKSIEFQAVIDKKQERSVKPVK